MLFKGHQFRQSRRIIALPVRAEDGSLMPYIEPGREQYIQFGRAVAGASGGKGLVKTDHRWSDTDAPVWAKPIPLDGHSLTNMAYGKDRHIYLMFDGACFIAKLPPRAAPTRG